MAFTPSFLSLLAAALYMLVVASTIYAAVVANARLQPSWHKITWLVSAALFVVLAMFRVLALEDLIREELRESLRSSSAYADRRWIQSVIASASVALAAASGFGLLFRMRAKLRGRRNLTLMIVIASCGSMLFLMALRLISFHWIDVLLYGSLKLNWIVDFGISVIVIGAAYFYIAILRSPREMARKKPVP